MEILAGLAKGFAISGMRLLWCKDRTWDPMDTKINWEILDESHVTLLISSFRHHGNVTGYESFIVVAGDEEGCNGMCGKVLSLLAGQIRVSGIGEAMVSSEYFVMEIRKNRNEFRDGIAQVSGSI